MISTIFLYITLCVCAAAVAALAKRYDLYIREPWHMILCAIALGAAAMWLAQRAEVVIIHAAADAGRFIGDTGLAFLAGAIEEAAKLGGVILIALVARRQFDEPLDGIIYGSFVGLGAALEESVVVLRNLDHVSFLPGQEPVRLAGHLIMGGIGGFGAGMLTLRPRRALLAIAMSFLGAAALHTAWDLAAFDAATFHRTQSQLRARHTLIPIALMLTGMVLYRRLVSVGASWTRFKLQVCDVRTHQCPPAPDGAK